MKRTIKLGAAVLSIAMIIAGCSAPRTNTVTVTTEREVVVPSPLGIIVAPPVTATAVAIPLAKLYTPLTVFIQARGPRSAVSGSGTIIDPRGYIVTNEHVIHHAESITVTLSDESKYQASLIYFNVERDLALIKLTTARTDFPTAVLGTMADVLVGEDVLALGYPLGTQLPGPVTVTRCIVSAVREVGGFRFIQTSVPISPGNSGGCLVNFEGRMIGVPSASFDQPNAQALNLAIPIDEVVAFLRANLPPD